MSARNRNSLLAFLALAAAASAAQAGSKEVIPVQEPEKKSSGWQFVIEAYGWATGISGTTGVNGFNTQINMDA